MSKIREYIELMLQKQILLESYTENQIDKIDLFYKNQIKHQLIWFYENHEKTGLVFPDGLEETQQDKKHLLEIVENVRANFCRNPYSGNSKKFDTWDLVFYNLMECKIYPSADISQRLAFFFWFFFRKKLILHPHNSLFKPITARLLISNDLYFENKYKFSQDLRDKSAFALKLPDYDIMDRFNYFGIKIDADITREPIDYF